MAKKGEEDISIGNVHLDSGDNKEIERQVQLTIVRSHSNMLKIGVAANILSGLFIIWIAHSLAATPILIAWYITLVLTSLSALGWAIRFDRTLVDPTVEKNWLTVFYFIVGAICLTWGGIGILFSSTQPYHELYIVSFLQVVLLGFAFTSLTDFTVAAVSIVCLSTPSIIYRLYLWYQSYNDSDLNIASIISLTILALFLLAVCYAGAKLVRKFFRINFTNTILSEKLSSLNKFLEQRVKERTAELENSLQLVTYQATHDLLTNLPNQLLLAEYTTTAINTSKNNFFALACFSLNEIGKINDWLGHGVGDLIIKIVAERFQDSLNELNTEKALTHYTVTLTRKDVFVILIENILPEQVEFKTKLLFKVIEEPIRIQDQNINFTATIGVSLYPRDGTDVEALLMNADSAMVYAKEKGGNQLYIYSSKIKDSFYKQIRIESKLHAALKNNEFLLYYQPIIDLKTNKIFGAEALVRWKNSVLGNIPPDDFIPLAEANGIIIPLGEWILTTACKELKKIHSMGFDQLQMSINLSSKQLYQKNIVETIVDIITASGLEPKFVELELTEREVFNEDVIPMLSEIQKNGICFAIDDFGTGHSGLSKLKLFPVDKIKIDKSFIKDIDTNSDSRDIVINMIDLAKKMRITVLLEGVETKEQLDFIKKQGCDLAQGYYFSKPLAEEDFIQLLLKEKSNQTIFPD